MKLLSCLVLISALLFTPVNAQQKRKTENVIFVMTDGLRWQEVFTGAEKALISTIAAKSMTDQEQITDQFWRETPEERRKELLPFFWNTIAKQGQIFGNRKNGSEGFVTNNLNFSYPGYSETLCGFVDPGINSNDKNPNPNVTVFEWLHRKPAFRGKIGAFAAWDAFPAIFNEDRAGFPVNAGWDLFTQVTGNANLDLVNRMKTETPRIWHNETFDAYTFHTALEFLKSKQPKVLYLSLGETDEWAHAGNYKDYLLAAHRVDQYLAQLWKTIQSLPQYKDKTTLIVATDHGRGEGPEWKNHGQKVPDSKYVWMAFLGPDTPALGERTKIPAVTQNQLAATMAAFLGENYVADVPEAGKPIGDVLKR